jgi:hypothetical protein
MLSQRANEVNGYRNQDRNEDARQGARNRAYAPNRNEDCKEKPSPEDWGNDPSRSRIQGQRKNYNGQEQRAAQHDQPDISNRIKHFRLRA